MEGPDKISEQARTSRAKRPWLAIFDLNVIKNSPAGSCVLAEVYGLADEYDITVFSDRFDDDKTGRIRWVRVPLPAKLGFIRYIFFNLLAPPALRRHSALRGASPTLIQATQGQFIGADICYAHFCHRAYLKNQWQYQTASGLRRLARWLAHQYNSMTEQLCFRRSRLVVAPSQGLVRELIETYPFLEGKIVAIPNPVDTAFFSRPKIFERTLFLAKIGLPTENCVLCFSALGDFSRKGLGILLEALSEIDDQSISLMVVGGNTGEVSEFTALARQLRVENRVVFTGFQSDIRPYLWASDLFILPSLYETFALVVIQAMVAGLPAIVTRLHGVEEYTTHGENAWLIERNVNSLKEAIQLATADRQRLKQMGVQAVKAAKFYDAAYFVERWRSVFGTMVNGKLDNLDNESI